MPKQDADFEILILQRMAEPFRLTMMHIKADAVTEISISHPENGFARRRINDAELASVHSPLQMWKGKIKDMRAELGFGTSDYDLPKTEDAVPIVVVAQSQHHTCGKHGNQLVAARNEETGETALRCPVVGCTTILRKRRKKQEPSTEFQQRIASNPISVSPLLSEPSSSVNIAGVDAPVYEGSFRVHTEAAIRAANVMHPEMGRPVF